MDTSFQELKCKSVINVVDGKNLGRICDVIFSNCSQRVIGFLVPVQKKSIFAKQESIFIPYNRICKIGVDVILVELFVAPPKAQNPICCLSEKNVYDTNDNDFVNENLYPK